MGKKILVVLACFAVFSTEAGAIGLAYDLVEANGGTKTNTNAYAGLSWALGGGLTPSIVLGVFNTRVQANNHTEGAGLSLHINLVDGFGASKLKLDYLNGRRDVQGTLGVGWDFKKSAPFVGLGANGPFVGAGVDASFDGSFVPFIDVHSQGQFKKNDQETQCANVGVGNGKFYDITCSQVDN